MAGFNKPNEQQEYNKPPPKTLEVLEMQIRCLKKRPLKMPRDNIAAARWWLGIIDPPRDSEAPREVSMTGDRTRWIAPYAERAVYTIERFTGFSSEDQDYILAAREDGVFWRGDDMKFFRNLYEETMNMRDIGREKYIARAKNVARGFVKAMAPSSL